MKAKSTLRILGTVLATFGLVLSVAVLVAMGLFLAASCTTSKPAPAYHFKPGPAYLPGAKPYVHERYPNHP
jgi:hypothetical protein